MQAPSPGRNFAINKLEMLLRSSYNNLQERLCWLHGHWRHWKTLSITISSQHYCPANLQRLPCCTCTRHRQAAGDGYHLVAWRTSCRCTVRVTKLHAVEGSNLSPCELHLFSPLKKVLKGHRPQPKGHIGAVIPIATHCAVSGGDPPVGVLVGCPWGMFLTAPSLLRAIPKQVWHKQGLSCTCYGHRCCCVLFRLQVILKV